MCRRMRSVLVWAVAVLFSAAFALSCGNGGGDAADDTGQRTADSVTPGPDTVEPGPDAVEPGPDTVEPGPDAVEPGPDTVEPGPDTVEPGPDTVEPGPDTVEPGPDTVEPGPDTVEPDVVEVPGEIGPDGGEVEGPNGTKLVIPAGALAEPVVFEVSVVAEPPAGDFSALSGAIEITPAGTQFLVDVQVVIPVESLPGTGKVAVYTAATVDGPWQAVPTEVVESTLVGTISHLSLFQAGMTELEGCEALCEVLGPCLISECGMESINLENFKTECPPLCEAELPMDEIAALLVAADGGCMSLLEAMVPYNPSLIEDCDIEVVGSCDEAAPFLLDCIEQICENLLPYHQAALDYYTYMCLANPDVFLEMQMAGCETVQSMYINEESLFWSLCETGPALGGADCQQVMQTFDACPMPAGSSYEQMGAGIFEFFVCGGVTPNFDPSCFLNAGSNCSAYVACLPPEN
jgi:hypothetical protein